MSRIVRPDEEIAFNIVSKRELAHLLNQQTDQLRTSDRQRAILCRILTAITRDVTILRPVDRWAVAVERAAVEAVDLASLRLNIHPTDAHIELVALEEPPGTPTAILTPKVVWS